MSLAQSSHSHRSAAWVLLVCAVPILCSLAWAPGSWPLLFLHKQKDEKLLKDTKAAGSQEMEIFPLFQELGL